MKTIKLFTDASVNPQNKIGFAAYLSILDEKYTYEDLEAQVETKMFENSSSTKLELQGFLYAINEITRNIKDKDSLKIIVYTDCQNILGLENRRERFEKNNYISKNGKIIANHELYKEFYKIIDSFTCEFVKVKGHKKQSLKDDIDKIFSLVDKHSREALRKHLDLI